VIAAAGNLLVRRTHRVDDQRQAADAFAGRASVNLRSSWKAFPLIGATNAQANTVRQPAHVGLCRHELADSQDGWANAIHPEDGMP